MRVDVKTKFAFTVLRPDITGTDHELTHCRCLSVPEGPEN
jgi:hypothetical protein